MLCPSCRRQLERGASFCGSCGTPLNGASAPLELVLGDATRIPVVSEMTIGRAPGVTLVLSDPSVSRVHARISADAVLEDAGSSHGTWLDGVRVTGPSPLRDGAKIRLGDAELRVERRRDAAEAGPDDRRPRGRLAARPVGRRAEPAASATQFGMRPRVRSGYALKRLDASEGRRRWVLQGPRDAGTFLRLSDNDAALFELLDGTHSLVELVGQCRAALRPAGAGAAGAAAVGPRRARLPGTASPAGSRWPRQPTGSAEAAVQAAREGLHRARAEARGALPRAAAGCSSRARR